MFFLSAFITTLLIAIARVSARRDVYKRQGKEGLQKLKEKEYQLVILDVMMPGMDGFETLEELSLIHI